MKQSRILAIVAVALLALTVGGVVFSQSHFGESGVRDRLISARKSSTVQSPSTSEPSADATPTIDPMEIGFRRAELALSEYELGVIEQPLGCNCGPRVDLYTENTPMQWCAAFASWVSKEAGSPFDNDGSWKIGNSREMSRYLEEFGTFHTREEIIDQGLTPRPGDFIIFFRGDFEEQLGHVDVLLNVTGDGRGDLVGGNFDNRVTLRSDFPYLDYYGFLGFGRPEID